jgi:hypothetical protein
MVGILTPRPAMEMAEECAAMTAAHELATALRLAFYAADEAPQLSLRARKQASDAFDRLLDAYGLQVVPRPVPIDASDAARSVA